MLTPTTTRSGGGRHYLNLAAEMQWQQLPPLESSMPSAEVAGFVEPAYGVGGDGFDYSVTGDVLDLVIYDAVGHGLHAALLSTLTIAALRHARRCQLGLAERLSAADEAIAADFAGDFVTAQVAQLSTSTGTLSWANAGHPPPILVRDGRSVGALQCEPRPPIGLSPLQTAPTVVQTVSLQPRDRVLFYTDGVVEGSRAAAPGSGPSGSPISWHDPTPTVWDAPRRCAASVTACSSTPTSSCTTTPR